MATNADFYVQESDQLIWIGSREYDGYPYATDLQPVFDSTTRAEFEQALVKVAESDENFTRREQGYPFGYQSSVESPFTYVFLEEGFVAIYKKGKPSKPDFPRLKFPDLANIRQPHLVLKAKSAGASAYIRPETDEDIEE